MLYELDVLPGLKELGLEEWSERLGRRAHQVPDADAEAIRFEWTGSPRALLDLRLAAAAHRALHFDIARPRQLLGDRDFRRLLAAIEEVRTGGSFTALRLNAAGAGSSVFRRLMSELGAALRLPVDNREGDLLLRIRPSQLRPAGWDVLIRLTPRPLATRGWRRANMPGALNANIAAAMVRLARPGPEDRVLNLMCGSGTLLAETAAAGPVRLLAGYDTDRASLGLAAANLAGGASLLRADAAALPCPDRAFDVLLADLPWGNLSGSHAQNVTLYPRALAEAARVAVAGARLALITHEIRLLEGSLEAQSDWRPLRTLRVLQGGQRPGLYLLERRT